MASSFTSPITATPSFNGTSQYAQSLQQVIDKAVSIAALPMQELQAAQTTTSNRITAEQSLQTVLTSLNTALQGMSTSNGNTVAASVSDSSVISASASPGALPAAYTINVTDPGSYTTAMSADALPKVTDPSSQNISAASSFTLTVGTNTYTLTPSGNNLNALLDAINSGGAAVQASLINVGPPAAPDYRLAIQSANIGNTSIGLSDGTSSLLNTLVTGSNAVYTVNGQPVGGISSDSNSVTIAPGVTVTLEAAGTSTLTVSRNVTSISNTLQAFVTAFNNAEAELQKSYGQNAGALGGDSTVLSASQDLSAIGNYSGSGSGTIQSLSDLGIEFTRTGTLTFDSTKLSAMSSNQIGDVVSFLGDPSTGGFLKSATDTMNGLLDPTNGIVSAEISALQQQNTDEGNAIQDQLDKINTLQANLNAQMSAADAAIASLEQQQQYLTQLFATMNANNNALS